MGCIGQHRRDAHRRHRSIEVVLMDDVRDPIGAARVRRLFEQRRVAEADDFLQREVARRMLERLTAVRLDARRILDLGSGDGADAAALRGRFAGAAVWAVDVAMPRLVRAMRPRGPARGPGGVIARWFRPDDGAAVQADFAALPFAPHSFDVLWSNLALHWCSEPHRVLPEWSRVTAIGGLVSFSAFGPDTLAEVREAFRAVDDDPHVIPFTDMHDYGDMLVAAGFTTPVVDVERLTLTYSTAAALWSDVRALGGHPAPRRAPGLKGRDYARRLDEALARTRDASGRYRLSFELIFAHAWKAEPRTTRGGEAIVRVSGRRS